MNLELKSISHRYEDLTVLDDINLEITEGQIICIVGPSGCGKSTLLRLIGGLEQASEGQILMQGMAATKSMNPLTYVFQDFALLPWRTVEENISLVLEDHPMPSSEREAIIHDVLDRTNLSDFGNVFPRQLSGGMKQRVAIARALAVKPEVMLMDEPLSALDSQTRELLMEDLVALWGREKFTAVYVTHNLSEAVRLGHRIVVLSRRPGRICEVVDIDTPLDERDAADPVLAEKVKTLWQLLHDEAAAADRELTNA